MSPEQVQLLRALGSGVRPVDLGEPAPSEHDRFNELLGDAIQGHARTELGVTFAPNASGKFDSSEQERIARAVDIAAAAGSEHALILHGRHTLRIDVRNRVVLDAPELQTRAPVTGIDAFVSAQAVDPQTIAEISAGSSDAPLEPARVVRNASLVRTLAQAAPAHAV